MTIHAKINFIQREEICKKYKDGANAYELAAEYDCAVSSIYRYLRDAKIPLRHQKRGFDGELADVLRKEYEAGATSTSLAKKYKTTKVRVCNYIREAGGQIRPQGPRKGSKKSSVLTERQKAMAKRNAKWREEYEAGSTLQQISERYDYISISAISNAIVKAGGTMRPTGYRPGEKNNRKPKKGLLAWAQSTNC